MPLAAEMRGMLDALLAPRGEAEGEAGEAGAVQRLLHRPVGGGAIRLGGRAQAVDPVGAEIAGGGGQRLQAEHVAVPPRAEHLAEPFQFALEQRGGVRLQQGGEQHERRAHAAQADAELVDALGRGGLGGGDVAKDLVEAARDDRAERLVRADRRVEAEFRRVRPRGGAPSRRR